MKKYLTGLHMVKTEDYYTEKLIKSQKKWYNIDYWLLDEIIISNICKEVFGLPTLDYQHRPILGIHFSLHR